MNHAIIAAGGKGNRFQGPVSKQMIPLNGKPLLYWALRPFEIVEAVDRVILVYPADEEEASYRRILEDEGFGKTRLVKGGPSRYDSVRNGFESIVPAGPADVVLIHDAARPLVSSGLLERVLQTAAGSGAAIPALPVSETVKEVEEGNVIRTVSRDKLFVAQTPQAFQYGVLQKAYRYAESHGAHWTDEAMLAENAGITIRIVPGEKSNIKVTNREDLFLAEFYLERGGRS